MNCIFLHFLNGRPCSCQYHKHHYQRHCWSVRGTLVCAALFRTRCAKSELALANSPPTQRQQQQLAFDYIPYSISLSSWGPLTLREIPHSELVRFVHLQVCCGGPDQDRRAGSFGQGYPFARRPGGPGTTLITSSSSPTRASGQSLCTRVWLKSPRRPLTHTRFHSCYYHYVCLPTA